MTGCKRERRSFRRSREVSVLEKLAIRVVGKFAHNGIFSGNRMLTFFFSFREVIFMGLVCCIVRLYFCLYEPRARVLQQTLKGLVIRES